MKEFKPYSLIDAFKKFHYPFLPVSFEPIDPLKGNMDAEAEAASMSCTFLMLHGIFMLCWYCIVFACWFYYFIGYFIYWLIASLIENSKNKTAGSSPPGNSDKSE